MLEMAAEGPEFPKPQTSSLMRQSGYVASLHLDKTKLVWGVVGVLF